MKKAFSLLLAFVLLCPILTVNAQEARKSVILGGMPFGLTLYTGGVIVINLDSDGAARAAGVRENDIITRVNGKEIQSNEQLRDLISSSQGADIELSIIRGKSPISITVTPKVSPDGSGTAGMWVRDSTAGLGTVTYFDSSTMTFGALGHGICDRDTGVLMPLSSGEIVEAEVDSVTKAKKGVAGGLNGTIGDTPIGELTVNSGYGVFGRYSVAPAGEEVECALDKDIHLGEATIYSTVDDGGVQAYSVRVENLNLSDTSGQNMIIRVTDEELLSKTGGIVQGMSGSPIVQDGRIIGAVTHVFVNTPEQGYGISIGNMLDCCEQYGQLKS